MAALPAFGRRLTTISGAAMGNRPGLQALLAAQVKLDVVMDLSRLSRSQADLPKMKNPETHQREARVRPAAEWVQVAMPELRIIDEELWQRVKARRAARTADNTPIDCRPKNCAPYRGVAGKRSKFLPSGLLKCAECGCSFVISDAQNYACASHTNGGDAACGNRLGVHRDLVEERVIGALLAELDVEIGRMVDALAGGLLYAPASAPPPNPKPPASSPSSRTPSPATSAPSATSPPRWRGP